MEKMANGFHIDVRKLINKITAFSVHCFRRRTCCRDSEGLMRLLL